MQLRSLIIIGIVILGLFAIGLTLQLQSRKTRDLNLPKVVDFNYHIRPILSQNCYVCHGPDESSREAGLRLDSAQFATGILESGHRAIVPHKPAKSSLLERIKSRVPSIQMPPPEAKKLLSEREIALIERWIRQGAKWKAHWAFIPPKIEGLPSNLENASSTQVIDYYINEALEDKGLTASDKAKSQNLIRRIAYILTGLPPSVEELNRFKKPSSIEEVVDYYLASPHFGERWARHWMDLVRYGESMGHEGDFNISNAYEYRDYLIRAFNQDVPYNLFVKEHLAGDLLDKPRRNPESGFNESIIGTGYFFLGEGKHSPVDTKLEESEKIDNMIDVTSKTFMSLTVACAKCHDHKFDPIPTTDYYAMYGMLESSRLGPIPARQTLQQESYLQELKSIKQEIRQKLGEQMVQSLQQPSAQLIKQQERYIRQEDNDTLNYKVIADFRFGDWNGWYTNGAAFGAGPLLAEPIINVEEKTIEGLQSGKATSRRLAKGLFGVLRSPDFTIEQDYIAVKAAGHNGLIRVIIDNFQVIQYPLWGGCEAIVQNPDWDIYKLDVRLAKGHKAYLQFMPGYYGKAREHIYRISPEDYIEIEYAVAYDETLPVLKGAEQLYEKEKQISSKGKALQNWLAGKSQAEEIATLNNIFERSTFDKQALDPLLDRYQELAPKLYDSTHFIGMNDGAAIFSPVFIRGSLTNLSKEQVPRKFLTALKHLNPNFPQEGSGRLAFAEALANPENPLTARIIVNRLWHHIFGKGIVETVDNFGLQGKLPSHGPLLDYLAINFMENGWSMKQFIKAVLLSETFQRSTNAIEVNAAIDPENIYLHHFPIRRLEAEAIRDGILATSGSLDSTFYGPPVPVHLTNYMTGRGRPRVSGPLDGAGRRSIYLTVRRNFIAPMFLAFDFPIPFSTFGKRNTTNVPAQSLTLMNDPFVKDQAEQWATQLCETDQSNEDRIKEIYNKAFARAPNEQEMEAAIAFVKQQALQLACDPTKIEKEVGVWKEYCHAIFNLKEFIYLL